MDEFAQTGAQQDDLFDDIQYDQSMQTRAPDDLFNDEIQPVKSEDQHNIQPDEKKGEPIDHQKEVPPVASSTEVVLESSTPTDTTPAPTSSAPTRGRAGRGRGRGRGGRNNQDRTTQEHKNRTTQEHNNQDRITQDRNNQDRNNQDRNNQDRNNQDRQNQNQDRKNQDRRNQNRNNQDRPNTDRRTNEPRRNQPNRNQKEAVSNDTDEQQQPQQPPTPTAEPAKPATNAVRGDRTATGGLRKPKLSEQELAEKMSRISLKNEKLAAAHARAEADAADFAEREEVAAKRRQEERRDRQQMMGEREKNRLRKLKAVGGREWDAEKPDDADAFGGPRQAGGRGRGAHGGIAGQRNPEGSREGFGGDREDYTDGREYMYREDRGRGRGRGRGGRGGSGRGGRGPQQEKQPSQSVPKPTDFPDLSGSASAPSFDSAAPPTMEFPTKAKVERLDIDDQITPGTEKKSWADMME
ncbi:hypothetical protein D6C92_09579 [Aureobasidium pullulans]|nr:hypothetical protein D6C92_09579 [Aureobasidium pullulans]